MLEEAVLVVRRDTDRQHSWVARGRGEVGVGKDYPADSTYPLPCSTLAFQGPEAGPRVGCHSRQSLPHAPAA